MKRSLRPVKRRLRLHVFLPSKKNAINKVQELRKDLERVNAEIEEAQRNYDLNKAAEQKYSKLPSLQKQLEEQEKTYLDMISKSRTK